MFAIGPVDRGSIPGRVILKTQKMVLDASFLNTQHYKAGSRVKWSNPGKRVALFPTPRCSSYWKGSLQVTLHYSHQFYIYIYIYIYNIYKLNAKLTFMKYFLYRLYEKFYIILTVFKVLLLMNKNIYTYRANISVTSRKTQQTLCYYRFISITLLIRIVSSNGVYWYWLSVINISWAHIFR